MEDENKQLKNLLLTMAFFVDKAVVGEEFDQLKEECQDFISHLLLELQKD
jgi:hypothetical protein